MLHDFGFSKRASVPTVDVKAEALAKTKATRKARHTMGSKQKQEITGQPESPAKPTA